VKWVVFGCAVIAVASFTFVYTAINTLCDDQYWPDW
jgi:hypothetical protein